LARRKSGAGADCAGRNAHRVGVEIGALLVDERNRLREQQRRKIIGRRGRLGDVEPMIRHIDAAMKEASVGQGDLQLPAGNARIVIEHRKVIADLSAAAQGLGGVGDELRIEVRAIGEIDDRDAEQAGVALDIELPGRRIAGAVAIGDVPDLGFAWELGGDAIRSSHTWHRR